MSTFLIDCLISYDVFDNTPELLIFVFALLLQSDVIIGSQDLCSDIFNNCCLMLSNWMISHFSQVFVCHKANNINHSQIQSI
jgi:hypothetical protein